mgnify:CR=1 FL=1
MLVIDNLHATVADKPILKGLSLTINAGEVHAIMGPNGAGKSTLSYVLTGREGYEVTGGTATLDGVDLLGLAPEERAAKGLFLSFQYPLEIPGVPAVTFLRAALNAQRKARGETPLNGGEFLKLALLVACANLLANRRDDMHDVMRTLVPALGLAALACTLCLAQGDLGSAIAPFNAFLISQGIETLSLRIERHVSNAQKVAEFLEGRAEVTSVAYAGLESSPWHERGKQLAPKGTGAIVAFELAGGVDAGKKFVNALTLHSHVANIGDVRSLVIHPASTTHSQLTPEEQLASGVTPGLVRLAVGIEGIDDILADLETGLAAAAS